MLRKRTSKPGGAGEAPKWAALAVLVLLGAGLVLGLADVYKTYYSSLTVFRFVVEVWDGISLWTGRIATVAGVLVPILAYLLRGRIPKERKWKDMIPAIVSRLRNLVFSRAVSFSLLPIVVLADVWLSYVLIVHHPPFPTPPSSIVIRPDGSEVYVVDETKGRIRRFEASTGKNELPSIDVGGHPRRILIGPRSGNLYVLDSQSSRITIIDPNSQKVLKTFSYVGRVSNSFILTPDERKLYISNEQPSPQATITVVDLTKPDHPAHSIEGFNCPEGLAIVPDGSKVYVSTQCGGQLDPVLVINTQTDDITKRLVGFAVGTADVAVAKGGRRVYVSRDRSATRDATGHVIAVPAQISSIDTVTDEKVEAETLLIAGSAFAVSPDGKFLFFANGPAIEILNTETRASRNVLVNARIAGIAVGKQGKTGSNLICYAWCPDRNWIFFTGLSGLLP
jgi:DNA-binding beta-propeller fold protein YncE